MAMQDDTSSCLTSGNREYISFKAYILKILVHTHLIMEHIICLCYVTN